MKFSQATILAVVLSAQVPLAAPFAPQNHRHHKHDYHTTSLAAGVTPPDPSSSSDWLISSLLNAAAVTPPPPPGTTETATAAATTAATTSTSIGTTLLQTAPLLLAPVAALVAGQQAYQAMQERNALQDQLEEQEADARVQEENLRQQQENIKSHQQAMQKMQQSIETTEQAMTNSFGAAALSSAISLGVLMGATVPDVSTLSNGNLPATTNSAVGGTVATTTERVVPSTTASSSTTSSSVTESRPSSSFLMGARARQEERQAAQEAAQAKRDAKRTEIEATMMRQQPNAETNTPESSSMNTLMSKIDDPTATQGQVQDNPAPESTLQAPEESRQTATSTNEMSMQEEAPQTTVEETNAPSASGTTSPMESLLSQATSAKEETKPESQSQQNAPSVPATMATVPSFNNNKQNVPEPPAPETTSATKPPPVSFMDTLMSKIDENIASKTQVPPPPPPTSSSKVEGSASKNTIAARFQGRTNQQKSETSFKKSESTKVESKGDIHAKVGGIMDKLNEQAVPFAIGAASLSVFAALGAAGDDDFESDTKPSEKHDDETFTPYGNATWKTTVADPSPRPAETSTPPAPVRFAAPKQDNPFVGQHKVLDKSYSPYGSSKNWSKKASSSGFQTNTASSTATSSAGPSQQQSGASDTRTNYSPFGQNGASESAKQENSQSAKGSFAPFGNKHWKKSPSDPKTLFAPSGTSQEPKDQEPKSWSPSTPSDEPPVVELNTQNPQSAKNLFAPFGNKDWKKSPSDPKTLFAPSGTSQEPKDQEPKSWSPSTPSDETPVVELNMQNPQSAKGSFSPFGNKDWKKSPSDPKTLFPTSSQEPKDQEPKSWPTSSPSDETPVIQVNTPGGTVQVTLPKGAAPIKGATPVSGFTSPSPNTIQSISEPVKASPPPPTSPAYGRSMPPPPVQEASVSSNTKPRAPTSGSYLDRISQSVALSNNPSGTASMGQMMQPAKPSFGSVSYMEAPRSDETTQEDYMPSLEDLEKQRDEYMDLN